MNTETVNKILIVVLVVFCIIIIKLYFEHKQISKINIEQQNKLNELSQRDKQLKQNFEYDNLSFLNPNYEINKQKNIKYLLRSTHDIEEQSIDNEELL